MGGGGDYSRRTTHSDARGCIDGLGLGEGERHALHTAHSEGPDAAAHGQVVKRESPPLSCVMTAANHADNSSALSGTVQSDSDRGSVRFFFSCPYTFLELPNNERHAIVNAACRASSC